MAKTAEVYEAEWRDKVGEADEVDWSSLDEAVTKLTRPIGSFTIIEFANKYKIHRDRARRALEALMTDNKVTKHRIGRQIYYKTVKGKK